MGRSAITDILSLPDPALSWNFDLFLPTIPGSSDTRDLTFKCKTAAMPGTQLESIDVELHGVTIPYAGRRMFTHDLSVTFLETMDWSTREKFRRWIATARDWRTNSGSNFATYAVTGLLITYDNIPQPVTTTQVNYMFPIDLADVELDGSQSGPVMPQVNFKYCDWQTV